MLMDIATAAQGTSLELHIFVYVTCLCDPSAISPIPNTHVTIGRPSISTLINDLLVSSSPSSSDVEIGAEAEGKSSQQNVVMRGGGVAVCASGPESLTREAQNAVARVGPGRAGMLGGIGIHTELFSL